MRSIRGAEIMIVPQEPMASLSPVHTIGNQIAEVISLHQKVGQVRPRESHRDARLAGLPKPEERVDTYPYQLSGGMRQRAMIAMALSCHPSLLIADEPTTALDVTTEAQILSLMRGLQGELGMAIMFITHNLGVIAQMERRCDRDVPGQSGGRGQSGRYLPQCQASVHASASAIYPAFRARLANASSWNRFAAPCPIPTPVPKVAPSTRAAASESPGCAIRKRRHMSKLNRGTKCGVSSTESFSIRSDSRTEARLPTKTRFPWMP